MSISIDYLVHFTKRLCLSLNFKCYLVEPIPIRKGFVVGAFTVSPSITNIIVSHGVPLHTVRNKVYLRVKELASTFTGLELSDLRIDGRLSSGSRIVVIRSK